jgi:hypothetical protein
MVAPGSRPPSSPPDVEPSLASEFVLARVFLPPLDRVPLVPKFVRSARFRSDERWLHRVAGKMRTGKMRRRRTSPELFLTPSETAC